MSWRRLLRPVVRTRLGKYLATSPVRPQYWRASLDAARILWFGYGHFESVRRYASIDGNGNPVPWYTYPAIEFLKQFDFSAASVFEYGSGNSTIFWSSRAARVVSVEDEEEWVEQLRPRLPPNCTFLYEHDLRRYPDAIRTSPGPFDVIVVDGPARARTRMKCAQAALPHLKPGGLIILDNSDWVPETAAVLRAADLLQVDMSGFAPIAAQTQTTSFFFHRDCRLQPLGGRQPLPSAGARLMDWDATESRPETPGAAGSDVTYDDQTFRGVRLDQQTIKSTPAGPRRFRVVLHTRGTRSVVALLDEDAGRIVLAAHSPVSGDAVAEAARLRDMDWDAFREFVRRHPHRYYRLE